ncbi:MAG: preprotein translocase subunit SecA [Minisyncoccia bacterium]
MTFLQKIFGDPNARTLSKIQPIVDNINSLEESYKAKSDDEIRAEILQIKSDIQERGASLDEVLPQVFAIVREASRRTLGQRHFDVQLIGGIVLHQGKIAEMRTGEGKTLVATLPTVLNALTGRGVHVVTVNDYLAKRDAVWMGQIYNFLGLSLGIVTAEGSYLYREVPEEDRERDEKGSYEVEAEFLSSASRKEAYEADITYGTNNEFGFDYLRDNMATSKSNMVQREYYFAIVDEVDSVLIDEARTPLIISRPDTDSPALYKTFASIVPTLKPETDYIIDEKMRTVNITESGIDKVEKSLNISNIYEEKGISFVHHLEQALKAQALFNLDKEYVVKDGEIIIVDQFTGRLTPGRRYSEGLHQAIEAKEGVMIQQESKTLASITLQNYFRMYDKLAGMTGTAVTSAEEFHKVYDLDVVIMPTNIKIKRIDLADVIYKNEKAKFTAIAKKIKEVSQQGQPVLLGTASIEKSEALGKVFDKFGLKYTILNAKQHEAEGLIIADAGKKGAITIATNMAGRGVDIKLGGANATDEEKNEILSLGGLYVIGTERHEARRIDNQLRGRSGRQGEHGVTQFYLSLDDEIMRIFGGEKIKSLMDRFNFPEDEPIENVLIAKSIEGAQTKIEGFHFDSRKHLLEYDDVLNKQRGIVYRKRQDILMEKTDIQSQTTELIKESVYKIVSFYTANESVREWDLKAIKEDINGLIGSKLDFATNLEQIKDQEGIVDKKKEDITDYLVKTIKDILQKRFSSISEEQYQSIMNSVYIQTLDNLWMDHLEIIDYLKTGIRLRGYAQRDPLIEYKNEAFMLFEKLLTSIQTNYINTILRIEPNPQIAQNIVSPSPMGESVPRVGRNDPCPCGSGKKYKKCHGK